MKRLKFAAPVLAIIVFATLLTNSLLPSFASTGGSSTMSLSPSSGTYNSGNSFTLTITENSGSVQINSVEADLTYNQNDLNLTSITANSSAFGVDAYQTSPSSANGSLSIQLGSTTPLTGSQTVATVTFKAASISTAAVSFANTSQILASSGNSNTLGTTTGGSYSIIASSCPAGQTGIPPNCVTPATPTIPTTPSKPVTTITTSTPVATTKTSTTTTNITPKGSSAPVSVASGSQVQISAPATIAPGNSSTTTLSSNTSDGSHYVVSSAITKVEYFLNNKLIDTKYSAPFAYKLNTTGLLNGSYTLTTKTYYSNGAISTSSQRLAVKNPLSLEQIGLATEHYAVPTVIILLLLVAAFLYVLRRDNLLSVWSRLRLNYASNNNDSPTLINNDMVPHPASLKPPVLPTPGNVITPTSPSDDQSNNDQLKPPPAV